MAQWLDSLQQAVREISKHVGDDYLVDEYTPKSLAPDSETSLYLTPQFRRLPEIIDHIIITGPAVGNQTSSQSTGSPVTNPGAGATIAQIGTAAQVTGLTYEINWAVGLEGTVTAADGNNMRLQGGPLPANVPAEYPGQTGVYPQEPIVVTVPTSGAGTILAVKSIGASSGASAVYSGQIEIVPLAVTVTLQLGDRVWPNLVIPVTGVLEISPKNMILQPQQIRQLTATNPGQYSLELLGRAYVGARS